MENNNKGTKVMALAALIVGVIGITIGFAAYTSSLTINSTATVTPEDEFNGTVVFTDESGETSELDCSQDAVGGATATASISGANVQVDANLAKPGDKVICKGKVKNGSKYTAYLTTIKANESGKKGEAVESSGATQTLIDAALKDIKLTVQIGSDTLNDGSSLQSGKGSIVAGASEDLTVTIEYASESSNLVDGKFKVTFPVVTAEYSTVRAGA